MMALQNLPFQTFCFQSFHINKSQPLGHGSYGAVYKAKCDQLTCAAKILHPTILDVEDPGSGKIMERFQQECAFLESIRHPHIVQYLGVTTDPDSRLPVLLMELLDENLTKMLEHSPQPLAYHVQVDICHDIALAVAYLHSNDIIHRDLSSNNVLIIAKRRAKVTDFGMSKLADSAPTTVALTMCPGTLVYMPPEALREPPRYTKKLDCFSEGVIMLQTCTRRWPEPGPRTTVIRDSRSPTGIVEMPVPETERRKSHIDLIDPSNDLLSISLDCLQFEDIDRPSSEEICQRMSALIVSAKYRESLQLEQDVIQAKDRQISSQTEQIQSMENEIHTKDIQLLEKDRELEQKQNELNEVLRQKERWHQEERELQQRQFQWSHTQLKEQQQITAEMQHANISLLKQVERLKQQLDRERHMLRRSMCLSSLPLSHAQQQYTEVSRSPKPVSSQVHQNSHGFPHKAWETTLNWKDAGKTPARMTRGAAIMNESVAYFMDCSGVLCAYNSTNKKLQELPKYPYEYGSLAIIDGALTGIGGCRDVFEQSTYTNKLLSLHNNSWADVFPQMPTKRHSTTTVTTNSIEHVIVAGGSSSPFTVNIVTVEVMDTQSQVWSSVASLPRPYSAASAIICGDRLYLLGGFDDRGKTKSVLTCSLSQLIGSSSLLSPSFVWHRVADAPMYRSTCAAVNGELLAVGGCDERGKARDVVYKYNRQTNSWNLIGNMPTARYNCLIATFPNSEIMVLGGTTQRYNTRKIDIGFPL